MRKLNSISANTVFRSTNLFGYFTKAPIGFIDIGAAGGVHSLVLPVASITNCLCFDASSCAAKALQSSNINIFSNCIVYNNAVAGKNGRIAFYITESAVNSSLLQPDVELVNRYGKNGMKIKKKTTVEARTLDSIIADVGKKYHVSGEIIKLDCQGAEYDILNAAAETLDHQCMAIWCEVIFFQAYKKQKTFSDVDKLLRSKGFVLYGLYPKYISKQIIDRKTYETNERLMWADALYIKDPLEQVNVKKHFTVRQINVLIICALLTGFFDYALEIIEAYKEDIVEKKVLTKFTLMLAKSEKAEIEGNAKQLVSKLIKYPNRHFLFAKKFIDENKRNNDLDFLKVS